MNEAYKKQVRLLLHVLPEVAKERCFAMHGGTAINLFVRDMPRLSVDVDLTYVEIAGRTETIEAVNAALDRVHKRIKKLSESLSVKHNQNICKLNISGEGCLVKIDVNMVNRGLLGDVYNAVLCPTAQASFDSFCVVPIAPLSQLYGGKICAALDRQHPRDLFDVKMMLVDEGFSEEIKQGLIFALLSSSRPTHELLAPNIIDQTNAFTNQFEGMSALPFSYQDHEATMLELVEIVNSSLTVADKQFLLSVVRLDPDWSVYNYQDYPSIQRKLFNLDEFKNRNLDKYQRQLDELAVVLRD